MTKTKLKREDARWWADIHDMALEVLTEEFQSLPKLRKAIGTESDPWFDLRVWGVAEEKREKLFRNGIGVGENVFYKKSLKQIQLENGIGPDEAPQGKEG